MKTSTIKNVAVGIALTANLFTPTIARADEAQDLKVISQLEEVLISGEENAMNCQKELQENGEPGTACLLLAVINKQQQALINPVYEIINRPTQDLTPEVKTRIFAVAAGMQRYTVEVNKATALFDVALEARDAAQANQSSSGTK